jgi:hypothetical protein
MRRQLKEKKGFVYIKTLAQLKRHFGAKDFEGCDMASAHGLNELMIQHFGKRLPKAWIKLDYEGRQDIMFTYPERLDVWYWAYESIVTAKVDRAINRLRRKI